MIQAKVVADSVSEWGDRLTTFEAVIHRYVLSELNTHRQFSRNSASSRAIPVAKQIERIKKDPAIPVEWGSAKPGMQAGGPLSDEDAKEARRLWLRGRNNAVRTAEALLELGLHKQVVNRLLEPFMWHTVVFTTSTPGLVNFFDQRCSPLAQPEIRVAAEAIREAYERSKPKRVDYGSWHLPYVDEQLPLDVAKKVSAARCARTSYLTQDGNRDPEEDVRLYERLVSARPMHASPLEHVATPVGIYDKCPGNFVGWKQLRHQVEREIHGD